MEWNGRRSSGLDGVFIRGSERLQRGQAHRNKNRGAEWKVISSPCHRAPANRYSGISRTALNLLGQLATPTPLSPYFYRATFFFFFFFFPAPFLSFVLFFFFSRIDSTIFEVDYLGNSGSLQ